MENERINKLVERFTKFRAELVKDDYTDNEVRDAAAMMFVGIGLAQGYTSKDLLNGINDTIKAMGTMMQQNNPKIIL